MNTMKILYHEALEVHRLLLQRRRVYRIAELMGRSKRWVKKVLKLTTADRKFWLDYAEDLPAQ